MEVRQCPLGSGARCVHWDLDCEEEEDEEEEEDAEAEEEEN